MRYRSTWPLLALITVLTVFSALVIWPGYPKQYGPNFIDYPEGPIIDVGNDAMRLGLDLKGGTYLLTEANLAVLPPGSDTDDAMDSVRDLMEERVNEFGVSETEVTREGRNRVAIQIPGIPPEEAERLIGRTALLQFTEAVRDPADDSRIMCVTDAGDTFSVAPSTGVSEGVDAEGNKIAQCTGDNMEVGTIQWVPARSDEGRVLTGREVDEAEATVDPQAGNVVILGFDGDGRSIWSDVTGRNVGYPVGIFLDDELLTAPAVSNQIEDGNTQITGFASLDEAKDVAKLINSGALPVPLRTIQVSEVDATLGERTLVRGVQAGIIGIMAVMAFMILYYRLPGVLASVALFTYIAIVMMVFKLGPVIGPVTITLAGIAGFVLSVGMAVDANILVFERMKEELRAGRNLASAIEHGFDRAWSSIRDSNASTLITCGILWWFGDRFNAQQVEGFAITLAIGVVISMFSAIVVTRTLLRMLVGTGVNRYPWLFAAEQRAPGAGGVRRFLPDFVGRRWFYFGLSALILVPGLLSLAVPPALKGGIEFESGATFTIDFVREDISVSAVEEVLEDLGYDARVQRTSEGNFIIRTEALETPAAPPVGTPPPSERDTVEEALSEEFGEFDTLNFNQVSEIVSEEIVRDAIIAALFASAAILAWITWSFRNVPKSYRYGIAAIVAALHDAIFVVGTFSILGKVFDMEVDSLFITGVLTVIGFSVHDTIVVFDRIRENVGSNPGVPFDEVVNASLTETLARSINTSLSVVLALTALLLLGAGNVDTLLITLLIGIIAGTYSSIFIASQLLVAWEDGDFARIWRKLTPWREREPLPAGA